jgi:hypothetical protein
VKEFENMRELCADYLIIYSSDTIHIYRKKTPYIE